MRLRWARLRFQIIGQLLAAPPEAGELEERLGALAHQKWSHPSTGELVQFGFSTIERWYYLARNEPLDPVKALERSHIDGRAAQALPRITASTSSRRASMSGRL